MGYASDDHEEPPKAQPLVVEKVEQTTKPEAKKKTDDVKANPAADGLQRSEGCAEGDQEEEEGHLRGRRARSAGLVAPHPEHVSEAGMFFKGELSGREEPPTDSEERTFNGLQHCTFRLLFASSP
ncbi:hypothetical protein AAVH_18976 [Aphelenchoides avenae]|nr:hypothetical protein AAVH_18976 [Aphelenchus avenae]